MEENLPLNCHGPEPCTSLKEDGIGNVWKNKKAKFAKKDSMSACDLREDTVFNPYMTELAEDWMMKIQDGMKLFFLTVHLKFWKNPTNTHNYICFMLGSTEEGTYFVLM